MGYTTKNTDIDLVIEPMPLSIEDRQTISSIIEHYKKTGEILKSVKKKQVSQNGLAMVID